MRVAKGANLMDADSCRLGEKEAVRGSGLGPCTTHDSLIVEDVRRSPDFGRGGLSSSRYAEPVADGMSPVWRTVLCQYRS